MVLSVVIAGFVPYVVSLLSAFGLGSVVGAYVSHRLSERRESAKEDREQALALGDVLGELRREFKRATALERRLAAPRKSYAAAVELLEGRLARLEGIERALRDQRLASDVAWLLQLLEAASRSLGLEGSSATVVVVDGAVQEVGRTARAFVRGEPAPNRPLRIA